MRQKKPISAQPSPSLLNCVDQRIAFDLTTNEFNQGNCRTIACNGAGGRADFEINASRAGPLMRGVRRLMTMHIRAHKKKLAVPIAALVFIGSGVLLVWTSSPRPKPALAVQLPFVSLQAGADDKGVHLIAMSQSGRQVPTIHIEAGFSADAKYHHGHVLNVLGFMIAVLPAEYDGGDYFISPYSALVLPYWLLIVGSGYLLAVLTPIATWLRPYCRVSKCSGGAGGVVLVLFVAMNVVPSAWCPGPAVQPQVIAEWIELTFEPGQAYSDIMLVYGFPDTCYKRGIVNRQSVDLFYGMSVGWKPHKAMENLCVAALTALAIVMVIEFLRQRGARVQTGPPNMTVNPSGDSGGL